MIRIEDAIIFAVTGMIFVVLLQIACGSRPRDLVDYDAVLVDTPWCIVAHVLDKDGIETPVRVCVPNQAFCEDGRKKARDSSMIQAFLKLTAIGVYEGNCDMCFLKSTRKRIRIAQEHPEFLSWWVNSEARSGDVFSRNSPPYKKLPVIGQSGCDLDADDDGDCFCTD